VVVYLVGLALAPGRVGAATKNQLIELTAVLDGASLCAVFLFISDGEFAGLLSFFLRSGTILGGLPKLIRR
jgi:hypothetical protein